MKLELTSTIFKEPKRDSSDCNSTMALSQSFRVVKSACSYQVVFPDRLTFDGTSGSTTSGGASLSGSGVRVRCDSNKYDGIRVSSLDARFMVPVRFVSIRERIKYKIK